jgi:oligopeptide transport system substrate-binding protein
MRQVAGAQDPEQAYKLQADAQAVLMKDLPAIPLWYSNIAAVYSKKVDNVTFNWQNQPEYAGITKAEGKILTHGTQPQNPLIPTATNEVGGGNVINQMYSGLVRYTADGETVNDVAESITSKDNKTWTVKIKSGQKFSDGSAVNADSFLKAWNYGAAGKNKQLNSYFFYPIVGFDDAQADKADTMSGLKKVDDSDLHDRTCSSRSELPSAFGLLSVLPGTGQGF